MLCLKNNIIILVLILFGLSFGQFSTFPKFGSFKSTGISFEAETQALLARMTTQSAVRQTQINNVITSLKTAGVWTKLDVLQIYAAATQADALLNWKGNANNAINTGSATFTADQGFTGNGSSTYLSSGFMPATHGVNYTQNSASMGVYDRTAGTFTTAQYIASYATAPIVYLLTQTLNNIYGRINSAAAGGFWDFYPGGAYTGLIEIDRYSATGIKGYLNGRSTNLDTVALTSTGRSVDSVHVLKTGQAASGYCPHQVSALYFGSTLSATEHLKLYSALEIYMDAVGCGVVPGDTLVSQNAEGAGYDYGEQWTEAGTVYEDSTTRPLRGAQSIYLANNSATISHNFSYSSDTTWVFLRFRADDATPSAQYSLISIRAVITSQMTVRQETSGRLSVNGTTVGTTILQNGTIYYIWLRYIVGTGSNAQAHVYLDTDETIPASPEISVTNGTMKKRVNNLLITGSPQSCFVDQIIVTKNSMGSVAP